MPRSYPQHAIKLKPGVIEDRTLLEIGRLVRAVAEIEDILDAFIAKVAGITKAQTAAMIGRTPITRRLEIAETLSKLRTDKALEHYKAAFPAIFKEVLDHRNAVCHGVFIGITENDEYAFLTNPTGMIEGDNLMRLVMILGHDAIAQTSASAEEAIPVLEETLLVQELRAERLQPSLKPHPKSQGRGRGT